MENQFLNAISNHFIKNRFIYLLSVICLVQIFLSGQANLSNYDSNHDVISYRKIASAFPSVDYSIGKPFAYRLLAPWLVGILFNDVDFGFTFLNALTSVLFIMTLFYFFKQNKISGRIAFFITAAFIFNRYFIPNYAYEPYRFTDVLSNLFLLLNFIFLTEKKYEIVFLLSLLGVLTKEIALIIIPIGITFILLNDKKNKLLIFIFYSLIIITIFISIRIFIPAEQGITLSQAFSENWKKIFSPEAIVKQLFLAFNPMFLIPLFYYKEFWRFNKNNLQWFVLLISVLFASLFGGDKERLMLPNIPIYYLFIALAFQKLEDSRTIKFSVWIIILLIIWVTNLHHIWGLIKLPSREISLAFALAGGVITLFIYLKLKMEREPISISSIP